MRAAEPIAMALVVCGCEASQGTTSSGASSSIKKEASAAPSSAKVASDEERQLDFMVLEADALTKAGPGCKEMAAALRTVRAKATKERGEVEARIAKKRRAGEKEPPLDEKGRARFEYVKKVTLESLEKCGEDREYLAALGDAEEPPKPASEWVVYRDPKRRFEAKFPASPEAGERKGPSSLTEAATLESSGFFFSASWMTLQEPAAYGCDVVLGAGVSRATDRGCVVDSNKPITVDGLAGHELEIHCPDGVSGLKRALCDSRPREHLVYLFETQALAAPGQSDKAMARTFVDGCRVIPSEAGATHR